MKLNNKSLCKHIFTALSLGGIAAVQAASVDNVDTNIGTPQSGASDLNKNVRALNGEPAKREDFPYLIFTSMNASSIGEKDFFKSCSLSLISKNIAITSASCFYDEENKRFRSQTSARVYAGSGKLKDMDTSDFKPYILHAHPDFSPETLENDIAIVELRLRSNTTSPPIAIYSGNVIDDMDLITIDHDPFPLENLALENIKIHKITQSPSSSSACKDFNANWSDNNKDVVCTLTKDDKGLSYGVYGNPLVYIKNDVSLLVGIAGNPGKSGSGATISPENAETNYYTHIYSYIDWIVNVTGVEKSYLLDTTARPSSNNSAIIDTATNTDTITNTNINTNTDKNTSGDQNTSTSTSTILQSTGFTLAILLLSLLALLF